MRMTLYEKFIWTVLAGLLIFTPLARGTVKVWSMTPVLSLAFLMIFVWVLRAVHYKKCCPEKTALGWPIIIFAAIAVISFIFSSYQYVSAYALVTLFGYIGIYCVVVNGFDRDMVKKILFLVIFLGGMMSIYGLLQYFGVLSRRWWDVEYFLSATYVNHNHFAGYLEMAIPIAIGMLFGRSRGESFKKAMLMIALVLMFSAFLLTQSRGAWICLLVSLLVMNIVLIRRVVLSQRNALLLLLSAGAVLFILSSTAPGLFTRVDAVVGGESEETSLETRIKIWQGSVEMIKRKPLVGNGIGTFAFGFPRHRPAGLMTKANFAHNDYLQVASEMGIFSCIAMLWALVVVIRTGLGDTKSSLGILGCTIGILSLSLHGLVDFNFRIGANILLLTVCAAFVTASESQNMNKEGNNA